MKQIQKRFGLTEKGARGMCIASVASFLVNVMYMAAMMVFFFFAQDLLEDGQLGNLSAYLIAILVVVVVMYLVLDFEYRATYNATYMESKDLRISITETLKELPLGYFAKHDLSDLAQTMMQDVLDLEHALSHAMPQAFGAIAFLVLMLVLIACSNPWVGLAMAIPIALPMAGLVFSKNYQKRWIRRFYGELRQNTETVQNLIEMQQEIRSYGLVSAKRREAHRAIRAVEVMHMHQELGQGLPVMSSSAVVKLTLASTALAVMWLLGQGAISPLYGVGYFLAAARLSDAVNGVGMNIGELFHIDVRVDRLKELKNTPRQTGGEVALSNYDVVVRDLSFSYEEHPVLQDVSFTAKQGEVTALVGPSGSGKTTMIRLLSRLYDYQSGSITIGGKELQDILPACLHKDISMVFQEVTLFNGSVLENIRIGRKDATDEEVMEAARKAHCEEFIKRLPDGYHTLIGENGSNLSGGERQRLSIARAFLKNAPILLLDEISASLDVENEMAIQESLNALMANKTVLIISHRMKSIERVNQIVVFDEGRVDAVGRHSELLQTSDLYRRLVEKSTLTENYVY